MILRACIALVLAVLLSLTSVTAAVARGQMAGATEMVVCAGGGAVTVTFDASGTPVVHAHHCPVCTATSSAVAPASVAGAARPLTRAEVVLPGVSPTAARAARRGAVARGPPRPV